MGTTNATDTLTLDDLGPATTGAQLDACLSDAARHAIGLPDAAKREWHTYAIECVGRIPAFANVASTHVNVALFKARRQAAAVPTPPPPPPTEAAPRPRGRWRTAAEMAAEEPQHVSWIAWPLAATGTTTLLSGPPKLAGKTTLTLAAVASILDGREWLGTPTVKGPVVYLTEEPDTAFVVALDRAGLLKHPDLHILSRHLATGSWEESARDARRKASEVGAVVLVVDTYAEWTELEGDAENNAGDVKRAMRPIRAAAAEKLAVVVVAHDRKSGGDVGQSVRGSTALPGAVDTIINVRPGDGPCARRLEMRGRLEVPPDLMIERTLEGGYIARGTAAKVARERAEANARSVAAQLLETIPLGEENAITREALYALRPKAITWREWEGAFQAERKAGAILRIGGQRSTGEARYWRPAAADSAAL